MREMLDRAIEDNDGYSDGERRMREEIDTRRREEEERMGGRKRRRRGDIVDGGGVRQYVLYGTIQYYDYEKTSPRRFSPAHRTAPGGIAALRKPRSKITRKGRFIKALAVAFVLGQLWAMAVDQGRYNDNCYQLILPPPVS